MQERADTTAHTVQSGETLSEIAAKYGVSAEEILAFNELDNPDAIYAGQQLLIPGQVGEPAPQACTVSNLARHSPASPRAVMIWRSGN